ncbi:MAG TPA: MFS transporter [Steroidobacteraceae bacterium]|nr:MFS transporter [Steroidobacteraceae bacterium]
MRASETSPPLLNRWTVAAAVAGNTLEFYDFLTYSTFAVFIGQAYFPSGSAFASLLLTLATFGVGFVTRPLGGLILGAYADRAGRRPALVLTITLMTAGTLALALTPTYGTIGVLAPLILIAGRLVQGLALGGDFGPATALLLECAPAGRRALFVSWQNASQGIAICAAGLVGLLLSLLLPVQQLAQWGWRLAFAVGLLIVPVGLYMRRRLPETLEAPGSHGGRAVLGLLWRRHRQLVVLGVLIILCLTVTAYLTSYMTTYALTSLGMATSDAMLATITTGVFMGAGALWGGQLSDRFGITPVMIVPRIVLTLAVYPAFLLLVKFPRTGVLVGVTALITTLGALSAAAATAALAAAFPNSVRSSGTAVCYAASVSIFGGTTQFVITWLIGVTGDRLAPAYYLIAASLVSLWAMFRLPGQHRLERVLI